MSKTLRCRLTAPEPWEQSCSHGPGLDLCNCYEKLEGKNDKVVVGHTVDVSAAVATVDLLCVTNISESLSDKLVLVIGESVCRAGGTGISISTSFV